MILSKTILEDKLSTGFRDLVMGEPSSHVSNLLNGKIQAMDTRLVLRYKDYRVDDDGKLRFDVKHKLIDFTNDGMYDIVLQFNKRV